MEHTERVIVDEESRKIILGCTCGWSQQLGLIEGAAATYADASAWANHFNFDARTSPFN